MDTSARVAIVGAGAIGSYVGIQLRKGGRRVDFIGSARVADAVNAAGLRLEYPDDRKEDFSPGELAFTSDYAACRSATLVVVAVKGTATGRVIEQLRPVLDAECTLLTLQNGVSNGSRFRHAFPSHQVIEGMVTANVVELGAGGDGAPAEGSGARFRLSRTGEIYLPRDRLASLGAFSSPSGLRVKPVADITGVLWSKLLLNLVNPLNALSGRPLREDLYDGTFRRLWCACMKEGMQALRAAGIALRRVSPLPTRYLPVMLGLPNWLFLRLAKNMTDLDAQAKTSMAQDLERGRPTEIELLSGEIIALGKRCGIPTPLNEAVYEAIAQVEQGHGSTAARLYRELAAGI